MLLTRVYANAVATFSIDASYVIDGAAKRGLRYERLDQLMVEHLMGAR